MTNSYFQLDKRRDGTYLIIYPPVDMGNPVDPIELTHYLDGYNIDYEKNVVYDLIKSVNERDEMRDVRITTLQIGNIDESLMVTMQGDCVSAIARFYPASKEGKLMSKDDIIYQLHRQGVKFGIDEEAIGYYIADRKYCTSYILADAEMPVEGSDAVIEYNFNTDLTKKPKMNEDGSVDFHQLDTVSVVEKDQVLATLTPAVQGKPGTDVMGRPIKPKKVSVKFLRQSKNTRMSPDGLKLYSNCNGHAMLVDGQIFVSDTYIVPANVDTSTGDIDYNGNVEITGNVNTGYKVYAHGDIVVNGIVEGAELVADGQIILKRGIQGMGKGVLKAGTNIVSRFIESAEVSAGGFIQTESIMHSKVSAGGEIVVKGRKGFITGGSIRSGKFIDAKTAGSVMGTSTVMEVGVNLSLTEKLKELEEERKTIDQQIDRATKIILFISKKLKDREALTPEKLEQFQSLSSNKKILENKLIDIDDEIDRISEELDNSVGGYILVDDIIYPGCKVTVSNVTTFIRSETKHCRLVRDGADVRVKAY